MKNLVSSALLALFALSVPAVAAAQSSGQLDGSNLGSFLRSIIEFINSFVIPFIWALAFIVFIWGVFQYFILGGANEEKRDEGKKLVTWGIVAFFIMSSLWGIVNLFTGTFQFGNENTPEYPTFNVSGRSSGNGNPNPPPPTPMGEDEVRDSDTFFQ